jgi:hypothetical protein
MSKQSSLFPDLSESESTPVTPLSATQDRAAPVLVPQRHQIELRPMQKGH